MTVHFNFLNIVHFDLLNTVHFHLLKGRPFLRMVIFWSSFDFSQFIKALYFWKLYILDHDRILFKQPVVKRAKDQTNSFHSIWNNFKQKFPIWDDLFVLSSNSNQLKLPNSLLRLWNSEHKNSSSDWLFSNQGWVIIYSCVGGRSRQNTWAKCDLFYGVLGTRIRIPPLSFTSISFSELLSSDWLITSPWALSDSSKGWPIGSDLKDKD